jgi:uncharacterized protein YbjT (DUF2867 family)
MQSRSRPVAIEDVVAALVAATVEEAEGHQIFDLPGPDTLTAAEILARVAELGGVRARTLPAPSIPPRLIGQLLRAVSGADPAITRELVAGLSSDLIGTHLDFFARIGHLPRDFDEAAGRALVKDAPLGIRAGLLESLVQRLAPA